IAAIGRATFTASFAHSMPEQDLQAYLSSSYTTSAILSELSNPNDNTFYVAHLAPASSAVAGFLQIKHGSTDPSLPADLRLVEIHRVYVGMEYHRRGIGGAMMEHVLGVLRREGAYEGAWLGVWEENVRAKKFYGGLGFTENVGRHSFTMGECVQWDEILLLRL
ncbi:acyl-CoA N-acyltransferase, partial [Paraphaeosphaeria sporulosa]